MNKTQSIIRGVTQTVTHKVWDSSNYFWALTREGAATLLTYELYPLGLVGKSLPAVPHLWAKKHPEKLPILFVHGVFHNRSAFAYLKQKLAARGWHHFKEMDLLTSIHSIPVLAEQVATKTKALLKEHHAPQIDIIAHSMGGVIARYFVQCLGGDGLVRNLITLGSPHQGAVLSRFSVLPHIREMRPGSATMQELNALPLPRYTQVTSVSGNLDLVMLSRNSTHWPGVRNIHLKKVGHAGLLFSKRVFQIIASHLSVPYEPPTLK